jgi:hypothetical protein
MSGGFFGDPSGQVEQVVTDALGHPGDEPAADETSPESAWTRLMGALGRDLQHGMWRAEQARRRMAKGL